MKKFIYNMERIEPSLIYMAAHDALESIEDVTGVRLLEEITATLIQKLQYRIGSPNRYIDLLFSVIRCALSAEAFAAGKYYATSQYNFSTLTGEEKEEFIEKLEQNKIAFTLIEKE